MLQRFRGSTFDEAASLAETVLGREAQIHSSQLVRCRGVRGLLGRQEVEVLASRRTTLTAPPPANVYKERRNKLRRLDEATNPVFNISSGIESLTRIYRFLLKVGVPDSLAESIALKLRRRVPAGRMRDMGLLKEHLRLSLRKLVRTSNPIEDVVGPSVSVLMGPTGVGKTTTVAKLAAQLKLYHNLSVALVTTDTFRVGAVDQISRYADALSVPLRITPCGPELVSTVRELEGYDAVLIDTAGMGSVEREWIERVGDAVKSLGRCSTHLLLNMGSHPANQVEVFRRISPMRIDNLILTKADECAVRGQILEVLVYTGVPVSYVTIGQNVPCDMFSATPAAIVDFILGIDFAEV